MSNSTDSAKKEMEGMKGDIENLVRRLGNVKDKSGDIMSEQLEELSSAITRLKGKGKEAGKDMLNELSTSTLEHPVRNLAYAFGAGVILALLIK